MAIIDSIERRSDKIMGIAGIILIINPSFKIHILVALVIAACRHIYDLFKRFAISFDNFYSKRMARNRY